MRIDRLPGGIGAVVYDLDLSQPLSADQERGLDAAWAETHALILRDQAALSTEAHVAFLARFGAVLEERIPGDQHSFVTNADGFGTDDMNDGYREGELTAHMDYTYTPYPAEVISLYATELPTKGSHTRFFSNTLPLARMPEDLAEKLRGYSLFCAHDLAQMKPDVRLYLEGPTRPDAPTQSHVWPMVREHPRKPSLEILFCTLQQTERIRELPETESRKLLGLVFDEFLYVPENEYRHEWQVGDLVVWDNLALQHARDACPADAGHRTFRRVAVCDAGNAIHETVRFLDLADSSVAF